MIAGRVALADVPVTIRPAMAQLSVH